MATMTSSSSERRHIPDRRGMGYTSERSTNERSNAASMADYTSSNDNIGRSRSHDASRAERSTTKQASRMGALDWIAMTLLIVGGLNWGAVGLFEMDVVARLFGEMTPISRLIYVLVGLSALWSIYTSSKMARKND